MQRINVWMISSEEMGDMISTILQPADLQYTFAVIMPDTEQPWNIMAHTEKWMKVLKESIYKVSNKIEDLRTLDKLKQRIEHLCKTYEEPEFDQQTGKFISKKIKKQA